jgi:hypothetical protein
MMMVMMMMMIVKEISNFHSVALSSILFRQSVVSRVTMDMVARIKASTPAEKRNELFYFLPSSTAD